MNCSGAVAPSVEFTAETLYIVVCYSIVFFFAFVGNAVMFLILFRNQCQKRRRVHSLLLHMTVAHLLVTMVYMPKEIIHNITVGWWGGDLLCRICKFFDVFGVALSAGILMCLSLDRFYSILFPLYVINAKRSVTRMLTVAWCVSILTSLPQIYIFRAAQHPCFDWYTQCVSADVIGLISPQVTFWFSVLNILQVYFLPLIVILICYGSILISISLKTRSASFARVDAAAGAAGAAANVQKRSSTQAHAAAAASTALSTSAFFTQNRVKSSPTIATAAKLSLALDGDIRCYPKGFMPKSNSISVSGIVTSSPICGGPGVGAGPGCGAAGNGGAASDAVLRRTGGENSFQRAKNRTLKMTVVLVFAFLLCWTPYTVAMFIHFFYASQRIIPPLLRKFLYAFAVFNSAISPYLYGYFSFDIWEELRLLLLYFCSTPGCLAHCGCKKLGKNSAESGANRRHAIRVRTTGELSSSTLLPPTTTVSGGSIRYKQQAGHLHAGNHAGGGSAENAAALCGEPPALQRGGEKSQSMLSFRGSKALSLDSTAPAALSMCYRGEPLVRLATVNHRAVTTATVAVNPTVGTIALASPTSDATDNPARECAAPCARKARKGVQLPRQQAGAQLVIANGAALANGSAGAGSDRSRAVKQAVPISRRTVGGRMDESRQPLLARQHGTDGADPADPLADGGAVGPPDRAQCSSFGSQHKTRI